MNRPPAEETSGWRRSNSARLLAAAPLRRAALALMAALLLLPGSALSPGSAAAAQPGPQPPTPDTAPYQSQPAHPSWESAPIPSYPDVGSEAPVPAMTRDASRPREPVYFPWYDSVSLRTWLHVANPGSAPLAAVVRLAGSEVARLAVAPGSSRYLILPGVSNGPLEILGDGPLVAVERTAAPGSISEFNGLRSTEASTRLAFNWYDSRSTGSWVHVVNPGPATAQVSLSVGGSVLWVRTIAAGAGDHVAIPGISAGPALLSSDQPVLGSERTVLAGSFFETAGRAVDGLAAESWYAWYDSISGLNDLHLANLGDSGAAVRVLLDQQTVWEGTLAAQDHTVLSFPTRLGGPLRVVADRPLLTAIRSVRHGVSIAFQEYPLVPAAEASRTHWGVWYDFASPGSYEDVHLAVPGGIDASATISLAGKTIWAGVVAAGRDRHVALPGAEGGPLYVASDQPILTWQRSIYDPVQPPNAAPHVVITLDDCGPPDTMRQMIAVIAQKHLPAIFFPTGRCRDANPWLVPEIQSRGYAVCNHTYSHLPLTSLSYAQAASEIAGGVHAGCNLLRPPYGAWDGPRGRTAQIAAAQGYRIFLWDIDTGDWAGTSAEFMLGKIRGHSGVVLMHFQGLHTLEALQAL